MTRARNPRRLTLEALRIMSDHLSVLRARWDVSMTLHDGTVWRKRREDEKPENQLVEWASLFNRCGLMIEQLTALQRLASDNYQKIKEAE